MPASTVKPVSKVGDKNAITVNVTDPQLKALKALGETHGGSVAYYVRLAIQEFLEG